MENLKKYGELPAVMWFFTQNKITMILQIIILFLVVVTRYPTEEIVYNNSDATWHTLLTMESYQETPVTEHLFLPIVSLGGEDNKWIPWGVALPDEKGNYYYTSFGTIGFLVPYLFVVLLRLPVNEFSLYLFNSVLYGCSTLIWVRFIRDVFSNSRYQYFFEWVSFFIYGFSPEIIHGMGIVYWHQSLMQVILPLQLLLYYRMAYQDNLKAKRGYYILCLLSPLTEWTGYFSNFGYALAEIIRYKREKRNACFSTAIITAILTVSSVILFCVHYLMRIKLSAFYDTVLSRMDARFFKAHQINFYQVCKLILGSFGYYGILAVLVAIFIFLVRIRSLRKKQSGFHVTDGYLVLTITFPLLEIIVLSEHARIYTYDRMKATFALSYFICIGTNYIFEKISNSKIVVTFLCGIAASGILNFYCYLNSGYITPVFYRADNEILGQYISAEYPDAVYGTYDISVRGYTNLVFHHGIYENITKELLIDTARKRHKRYTVMINAGKRDTFNIHEFCSVEIYDISNRTTTTVSVKDSKIIVS